MDKRHTIVFFWQGISGRYGIWKDGLWAAMKLIEKEHNVLYCEPQDPIPEDAIVLYWEAPVTIMGKDSENYKRVLSLPNKKALLFAGGPLKKEWVSSFDHIFVESQLNVKECQELGISHSVAFGINEEIMYPQILEKWYDGIHHGTCASWKRQWLVGEALGENGVVVGRYQESDRYPFDRCKELHTEVLGEKTPQEICELLNRSYVCVQTSDYWGGGQRCTLEAMSCGIPVVCMTDSPKNREYIEESGIGMIVEPDAFSIKKAVEYLKANPIDIQKSRDYIMSKWTARHYADSLLLFINNTK